MKKSIIFIPILIIGMAGAIPLAYASCTNNIGQKCLKNEAEKSNESRGGLSASEYCAALAYTECQSSAGSNSYERKTPKLQDNKDCTRLAQKSGQWDKNVFHDCMSTPAPFRW